MKGNYSEALSLIPKNLLQITLRANINLNRLPLPSLSLSLSEFTTSPANKAKSGLGWGPAAIWVPLWWIEHGTYANSPRFLASTTRILTQPRLHLECAVVAVKQSARRCCSCCCLGLNCFYLLSLLDGKQTLWPRCRAAHTFAGGRAQSVSTACTSRMPGQKGLQWTVHARPWIITKKYRFSPEVFSIDDQTFRNRVLSIIHILHLIS